MSFNNLKHASLCMEMKCPLFSQYLSLSLSVYEFIVILPICIIYGFLFPCFLILFLVFLTSFCSNSFAILTCKFLGHSDRTFKSGVPELEMNFLTP
ncbi:hypothetical protein FOCC_FOCC002984 [Frankliniella occidentalis]|nr:hypothetical protein FOCC_FOCC002984 [Frankliniella occidentalis]